MYYKIIKTADETRERENERQIKKERLIQKQKKKEIIFIFK